MRLSATLKSNIGKVLVITLFFVLINWFMTIHNHALLHSGWSLGTQGYDLFVTFLSNTLTGILAGLMGGTTLVFVNQKYFRKKSYSFALKATFLSYTLVFVLVSMSMTLINAWINIGSFPSLSVWGEAMKFFLLSQMGLVYYTFWGIVSIFSLFFLQIFDKFGPGLFLKFLTGKYHSPRDEDRIFMFLDLRSSTTIAEKIGNKQYFDLLNNLFNDVTDPILASEGEIYQYIGDEVVVSWSVEKGTRQSNCLDCFHKIQQHVRDLGPQYEKEYGIRPEFKAAVHYGAVTAGEIGGIKRDIVYSGDVLNTTSRIQEQCNRYDVDFLVSDDALSLLGKDLPYERVPMGSIELRGKQNKVEINTLKVA